MARKESLAFTAYGSRESDATFPNRSHLRRRETVLPTRLGVAQMDGRGKSLAILTSGGDSPGMNAAVRAVVRLALYHMMEAYAVYEGYDGLVQGGDMIRKMAWRDVAGILGKGGTVIGTARCQEFRERSGRLRAAKNLVERRINNLVVIGGDGSLTGAALFKSEWTSLLDELIATKQIESDEHVERLRAGLFLIGMVGSIDNDMCGTDLTIGADSALHRIIEACDAISSTAMSHKRTFVLEIMGRNCGYLALMGAIASGADWVLIPESPPDVEDWESLMCEHLARSRARGRRLCIVLVAEGAKDRRGNAITSQYVKDVIVDRLKHDTRITVLGHVQRGGPPSYLDRFQGTVQGARAIELILSERDPSEPPIMLAFEGNETVEVNLMEAVQRCKDVASAVAAQDFAKAMSLRGRRYALAFHTFKMVNGVRDEIESHASTKLRPFRVAIMAVGQASSGMNPAIRAAVHLLTGQGHTVLGVLNGFEGLLRNDVVELNWESVNGWEDIAGCQLGTNRTQPTHHLERCAVTLAARQINALLVVGGFEAFSGLVEWLKCREEYAALRIPICMLPATISNNIPGTKYTVGCDTALNMITAAVDILKQSATSTRRRVFVVETQGFFSGYLAVMAGLASGAERAYTFSEGVTLKDLMLDLQHMKKRFEEGSTCAVMLRNERCSETYTAEFMTQLFGEEGKGEFTCRMNVLGHLQQGWRPSPQDRLMAVEFAARGTEWLIERCRENMRADGVVEAKNSGTTVLLGYDTRNFDFFPVEFLVDQADFVHRLPSIDQRWWLRYSRLLFQLAKYGYEEEAQPPSTVARNTSWTSLPD